MRKRMKTMLLLAGATCIASLAAIGFCSCGEDKIEFLTTELKYEIGDNIDVFTYVKKDTDYNYEFSYQKKGSDEIKAVNGRTFAVDEAGVYILHCKATKDSKIIEDSVEIIVYDLVPFAIVPNQNMTVELYSEYTLNSLININGNVFIVSSSSTIRLIDYGEYFENEMDKEGEIVKFYDTTKPMEEFDLIEYKKQKIKFDKEGIWDFHVHVQNKGGIADGKFRVKVSEDLNKMTDISDTHDASFNINTLKAEWDAVEGAAGYRVKIGSYVFSTTDLSADMSGAYFPPFEFFDLVIVPYGEDGYNLGKKIIIENLVVSPDGYAGVVLGGAGADLNQANRTVTLTASTVSSNAWWTDVQKGDNGYVAMTGDYGVGYYVETTFGASTEMIGSIPTDFGSVNMPQIVLFADQVNGNKSSVGGKGLLLSSGIGAWAQNTAQTGLHATMDEFSIHGVNRAVRNSTTDYPRLVKTSEYPLLTQNGLKTYGAGKTYKYIVGTKYSEWGYLLVDVTLLEKVGNDFVEIKTADGKSYTNILFNTGLKKADVDELGTNIILMAENKYRTYKPTTTFTFEMPKFVSAGYTGEVPVLKSYGATLSADGSLSMAHKSTPASSFKATNAGQWATYHNYFAFQGDYGVGNYLDFSFTGLNMPQFIFFADSAEGDTAYQSITNYGSGKNTSNSVSQGRKGLVVLNGMGTRDQWLQVFGPNRMNGGAEYGATGKGELLTVVYGDENGAYNELIRKGQAENKTKQYNLTVGTHLGEDGMVWLEMILKDASGNEICHLDKSLGLTETEVGMGDIIVLPPFANYGTDLVDAKPDKGGTTCVFESISLPYVKGKEGN